MKKVAVLLSTYNGDDYIKKQIESIYRQNYSDFQLYVRDDGSSETFVNQLKLLQKEYPFVLMLGTNIGFVASFMTLLEKVEDAELYAFADQDDIWFEDKLKRAVDWFDKQENDKTPRLYHSAYNVIDNQNHVIEKFYFKNEGYDFRRSITENHYSGFSMVVNARLREYMLKGEWNKIGYHDWWAAMIVQAFGEAYSDEEVMALHRAHGDNITTFNILTRIQWFKKTLSEESEIRTRAIEFKRCFENELTSQNKAILSMFSVRGYHLKKALKKCFYPKRWRPIFSSEIIMRFLMLIGRV